MHIQSNWWENFFSGPAVDLWLQAISPEQSQKEAELVIRNLGVQTGAELLDVPCGAGRLTLPLSSRGYRLTGVDWSAEFLDHARSTDSDGRVTWERRDMRDLPWRARFDGAFCLGNSFGYFDDEGNEAFLRAVCTGLKPGARFVLETPMVLESLVRSVTDRPWFKAGEVYLLVTNLYDHTRGRLDIDYTFVSKGKVEVRRGSHRAYTYRQLVELMERVGFAVEAAEPWTRDAHRVLLVGTRIANS